MTSYPAGGMVPHYIQGTEFYSHAEAKVLAETYYNIEMIYIKHYSQIFIGQILLPKKMSGVCILCLLIYHFPVK